jgi:hypothetical protein
MGKNCGADMMYAVPIGCHAGGIKNNIAEISSWILSKLGEDRISVL